MVGNDFKVKKTLLLEIYLFLLNSMSTFHRTNTFTYIKSHIYGSTRTFHSNYTKYYVSTSVPKHVWSHAYKLHILRNKHVSNIGYLYFRNYIRLGPYYLNNFYMCFNYKISLLNMNFYLFISKNNSEGLFFKFFSHHDQFLIFFNVLYFYISINVQSLYRANKV